MQVNPTILIVEDDELLRVMLKEAFERRGFFVRDAGTVAEALLTAAAHTIDVVLTDFQLPDSDGLSLCRSLGNLMRAFDRHIPVWMMTGSHLVTPEEAVEVEIRQVFRKPFPAKVAVEAIERFLRGEVERRETEHATSRNR